MNRRNFVQDISVATIGAGLCGWMAGCSNLAYVRANIDSGSLVVPKTELADHPFVLVSFAGSDRPIYLHRHGPDEFTAVLTRCAHKGCQVEPQGDLLVCPCHGSEYTVTGELLKSPAERDLKRYEVATDTSNVYIALN